MIRDDTKRSIKDFYDYGVSIVLLFLNLLSGNRNFLLRFSSLPKNQDTKVRNKADYTNCRRFHKSRGLSKELRILSLALSQICKNTYS